MLSKERREEKGRVAVGKALGVSAGFVQSQKTAWRSAQHLTPMSKILQDHKEIKPAHVEKPQTSSCHPLGPPLRHGLGHGQALPLGGDFCSWKEMTMLLPRQLPLIP